MACVNILLGTDNYRNILNEHNTQSTNTVSDVIADREKERKDESWEQHEHACAGRRVTATDN
jgi:hypothetical protein